MYLSHEGVVCYINLARSIVANDVCSACDADLTIAIEFLVSLPNLEKNSPWLYKPSVTSFQLVTYTLKVVPPD